MKNLKTQNTALTFKKFQISSIKNPHTILGGNVVIGNNGSYFTDDDDDDIDTGDTRTRKG